MMPVIAFLVGEKRDPVFTLQRIIDGKFDDDLLNYGRMTRIGYTISIMADFGPQMNGDWFPWSRMYENGGGKKDGYGDRETADGPERFRDAYRHIINLFRKEVIKNITWAFHVFPP